MTYDEVLRELIDNWVSLGLEYSQGAHVTKLFIYAASEEGSAYANIFYEQDGQVVYPHELRGIDTGRERVLAVQRYLRVDLKAAEGKLRELGASVPTQYRVTYDLASRQLDMQLSHDVIYAGHPTKVMEEGAEDWLDGRLRKIFG
ncbi:hypothetical protein [Clavibacter sp. VKM Ac-2872]|uniref:hypothetical protein n=1 Tax=Clavibacter sp. VKM Ac-2872 TaxID=2783812 RepID=UPI00188B470C|nr:hypothetical protein [Clavibacter sp. VKM Ac-2872]MBF4624014.1 hypothetical protein [Clavibacter sp. VKM Ac-2872]